MVKITVVVPVYNEEQSILEVLDGIKKVMKTTDHEIIVVDDCSTDNTPQILKKTDAKVVRHVVNKGYGASLKTGILYAENDWILTIDADGSYSADEIPKLLKYVPYYDMVVGARIGEKVKIETFRKPAKFILGQLANYLSGTKILDLNSGLRIFRKQLATKFFDLLPSKFSFTTTITLSFLSEDYNVKYVPINYNKRIGKSKIRPHMFFNFILLIIRTIIYFNPLKIFLPTSALFILVALTIFLYGYIIVGKVVFDLTIVTFALTGIQIAFFGLLADLVSKKKLQVNFNG